MCFSKFQLSNMYMYIHLDMVCSRIYGVITNLTSIVENVRVKSTGERRNSAGWNGAVLCIKETSHTVPVLFIGESGPLLIYF